MNRFDQQDLSSDIKKVQDLIYEARDRNESLRLLACANEIEHILKALNETQLELNDYKFIARHRYNELTEYWHKEREFGWAIPEDKS